MLTEIEREFARLAEERLRWRGKPEVIAMIDVMMSMLTRVAAAYGDDEPEGIDADAIELAGLVTKALATVS